MSKSCQQRKQLQEALIEVNVNKIFDKYREAARHLRNVYYCNNNHESDWGLRSDFNEIRKLLYHHLILNELDLTEVRDFRNEPSKYFNLVSDGNILPAMINRNGDSGYWDHPITKLVDDEYDIRFIDYFDFDQMGHCDFRYILARIFFSKNHPQINNYNALIETQYVQILFNKSAQQSNPAPSRDF